MNSHPMDDPYYCFYTTIPITSIVIALWYSIFNDINEQIKNTHITQNIVNLIHASSVSILLSCVEYDTIYYPLWCLSGAFFINDIFVNVKLSLIEKKNPLWNPFILHHIIAFYGLALAYFDYYREVIFTCYYIFELSNILMYLTMISKSLAPSYANLHLILLHYQFITFVPLRVFVYPYYLFIARFNVFYDMNITCKLCAIVIYTFGAVWGRELLHRCIQSIRAQTFVLHN
jgi:hypothetical protein